MALWIDTDPALGARFRDVDDAIAIHALVCAEAEIAGISSCYGNAPLEVTHAVATELGERWGLDVARGAARPGESDTEAVEALVAHRGDVLAIGPMTNIAAALLRGASWTRLILLGGTDRRLPNWLRVHTTELNFALDEPAARVALEACDALFPMEVCRQVQFGAKEVAALPSWMAERCQSWLWASVLQRGRRRFPPWDLLPAMALLDPPLIRMERRRVTFAGRPAFRGYVRFGEGRPMDVAVHVDPQRFTERWREIVRRR